MVTLNIRTNFPDVIAKLDKLQAQVGDQAMRMALNRTAERAKAEAGRLITSEFAIKAGDVRPLLKVKQAERKSVVLEAVLEAFPVRRGHRSRNVMLFGAKQRKGRLKTITVQTKTGSYKRKARVGGGVTVKIKRAASRKLIAGAFIGNSGRTVFQRVGKERLPIRGVETIDLPQMFNARRINRGIVRKILEQLPVEFDRAAAVALARFNRP